MVSDERFFAWLDGELEPEDAAKVAAEVAADADLSRRAEQHRALQQQLKSAFDGVARAPVPARLSAAAETNVVVFGSAAAQRAKWRLPAGPQWGALAATLAVGIFAGMFVTQRGASPVSVEGGKIYAAAALDQALDTQLASAPAGDVRIGLTFRDSSGAICRTFTEAATSGLACRDGQQWRLRGLFASPEGQAGAYRMAAGGDPNLAAMVGSAMAGEPFDAAAEKAARDRDWR